jgi:hypothetical protein
MAVEFGGEGALGVVGVDDGDVVEAEDGFGALDGIAESGFGGDIEAGGVEVAGVEAVADGEGTRGAGRVRGWLEVFEGAADGGAGAGGVFEQEGEAGGHGAAGGGFLEGIGEALDAFFEGAGPCGSRGA